MNKYLYIVGKLDGTLKKRAEKWQLRLEDKFNLYNGKTPPLHLTIEAFSFDDFNQLERLKLVVEELGKIVEHTNKFTLETSGFTRFPEPYKTICINVTPNNDLINLHIKLRHKLEQLNLQPRPIDIKDTKYHISLVGSTMGRDWSDSEFNQAWSWVKNHFFSHRCTVSGIEIWFPRYLPFIECAASWQLK